MNLDFSRCRPVELADGTLSYVKDHVKIGVQELIKNPFLGIFDEMGGMKSAQVIIGSQFMYEADMINRVIVVAPASVRPVWFDPELGELSKHLFVDNNSLISEFHARIGQWYWGKPVEPRLRWIITNYDFIRMRNRLAQILAYCGPKTLLVLDESSAVKNWNTEQTKACLTMRRACGRVILLNGTPIANTPMDMYSQGNIMSPTILGVKSYFHFRARYAILGGFMQKQIIGYQNLEDLQNRFKPYVIRRLKRECLDLPEALPPVTLTVTLTEKTWKIYKQMRDDMVAWLSDDSLAVAAQAAVKSMRLAQITSGFVGGVEDAPTEDDDEKPQRLSFIEEVGREKLDFMLGWTDDRLTEDDKFKLVTWCRFIPELKRYMREVQRTFPKMLVGAYAGTPIFNKSQKEEREYAHRLLDPRTSPDNAITVGGTFGTGSLGHNFTASHTMVNMSSDYAYWKSEQANARIDRPGQLHTTSYFDVVAVGPAGQKTIDHTIVKARRGKEEIAKWTCAAWIKALTEE